MKLGIVFVVTIRTTRQSTRDISQASFSDVAHVITPETINWELAQAEESLANLYSQQRQLINWKLELIARVETHNLLCQHVCNPAFPNNEHWQLEREVRQYHATKNEVDEAIKEALEEVQRLQQ